MRRSFPLFAALALFSGCSDSTGVAIPVTLSLYSIDGVVVPMQLPSHGGKLVTVAAGKLQGNNWGHACGVSLRLVEGSITAADVPACRLEPGEERTFTLTLPDSRFPAGAHEYRFVP